LVFKRRWELWRRKEPNTILPGDRADILRAQLWTAHLRPRPGRPTDAAYEALFEIVLVEGADGSACLDVLSTHVAAWAAGAAASTPGRRRGCGLDGGGGGGAEGYGCGLLPRNAGLVCRFPPALATGVRRRLLEDCPRNLMGQTTDLRMSPFVMNRALQVLSSSSSVRSDAGSARGGGVGGTDGGDGGVVERRAGSMECLAAIVVRSNDYGGEDAQRAQHFVYPIDWAGVIILVMGEKGEKSLKRFPGP
jgi:hypothetical protein